MVHIDFGFILVRRKRGEFFSFFLEKKKQSVTPPDAGRDLRGSRWVELARASWVLELATRRAAGAALVLWHTALQYAFS